MRWQQEDYFITTDNALLDFPAILRFISEDSYWGKGRTAEIMHRAIDNSTLCFGLYHETEAGSVLAGFARVISDLTVFAYLSDVFVLPEHRGKGLGKWLIQSICDHPDLHGLKNICLITRTPEFYQPLSFAVLEEANVRKFMMKVATQATTQKELIS